MAHDELTFRPYTADDIPFLHSSWGHSYYKGSNASKHLSPDEFHRYHRPIRERFFSRPSATVIVASSPEDPWLIAGWIAVEVTEAGLILQYIYVKSTFKGEKIASALIARALPRKPIFFTHLTEKASRILAKKYGDLREFVHVPHLV